MPIQVDGNKMGFMVLVLLVAFKVLEEEVQNWSFLINCSLINFVCVIPKSGFLIGYLKLLMKN